MNLCKARKVEPLKVIEHPHSTLAREAYILNGAGRQTY